MFKKLNHTSTNKIIKRDKTTILVYTYKVYTNYAYIIDLLCETLYNANMIQNKLHFFRICKNELIYMITKLVKLLLLKF